MKKSYLLVLICSLLSLTARAQNEEWLWAVTADEGVESEITDMALDGEGNVYAVGNFSSGSITFGSQTFYNAFTPQQSFLVKYSADGSLQWAKGISSTTGMGIRQVETDAAGNIYIAAGFEGTVTIESQEYTSEPGLLAGLLAKFTPEGNAVFINFSDTTSVIPAILKVAGDYIYTAGTFTGSISLAGTTAQSNGANYVCIARYDLSGNPLWLSTLGGEQEDFVTGLTVDAAGVYISGTHYSENISYGNTAVVNTGNPESNVFVAKTATDGQAQWIINHDSPSSDTGTIITTDNQGNIYAVYIFHTGNFILGDTEITQSGPGDTLIVKYDANGNVVWYDHVGGNEGGNLLGIAVDENNNVYVTGFTYSGAITLGGTVQSFNGECSLYVAGLDADDNLLWFKKAGLLAPTNSQAIALDQSGNIFIGGRAKTITFGNTTLTNTLPNMFIAKLGEENVTGLQNEAQNTISIYPNPAKDMLFLPEGIADAPYTITDNTGRVISSGTSGGGIEVSGLSSGIYNISVDGKNTKFIKE